MNHLANETSPYLLQHRENPVDWYPWGEAARARAAELDRPLLVSIGYSACHWCHVMAHESFEDEATAALINANFVAIKVDREERPDLDAIYMEAAQALMGSGGWPLNVFCTSDGRPFFAGTYFPRRPIGRTPSFSDILRAVADAWSNQRSDIVEQADELTAAVGRRLDAPPPGRRPTGREIEEQFVAQYAARFDAEFGGLGESPKFPQPPMLERLLAATVSGNATAKEMLDVTLTHLASGGIYDHLGGGFSRYSVDRTWTVPHFEKMLYDQAGLARVYARAFAVTGDPRWRRVALDTCLYVLGDLALPDGGFASAEDADSEGEEGRFYVWTPDEVDRVAGPVLSGVARATYGLDGPPNFDGAWILVRRPGELERTASLEQARAKLFSARAERVRPGLDDKVLTEWNAMMIATLAEAAGLLDEQELLRAALEAAEFLLVVLRREDGRWLRAYKGGRSQHLALLGDEAWLASAFLAIYEATGRRRWLDQALEVADDLVVRFDAPDGTLFSTGDDAESLVVRPRDLYDGVVPAASSVAADVLTRLGTIAGRPELTERAGRILDGAGAALERSPIALAHLAGVARSLDDGTVEVVVTGDRPDLVATARRRYLRGGVVVWGDERGPLFEGRSGPYAWVCVGGACQRPVGDAEALEADIRAAVTGSGR